MKHNVNYHSHVISLTTNLHLCLPVLKTVKYFNNKKNEKPFATD